MADLETVKKVIASGKNPLIENVYVGGNTGSDAKYKVYIESPQQGVEPFYFWILSFLQKKPLGLGFDRIEKIKDVFSASETSAYWGDVEARRAIQQDRFEKYMTNVGAMTKSLIQQLRDLRILEERLEYYHGANKGEEASMTALKTIWTDLVEGKSPTSVFALAGQPGYVTLPDLFFKVIPKSSADADINRVVDTLEMNERVKSVLKQKLKKFLLWKEATFKELEQRWKFQLKYLRQHMQVIKLYLTWLKPYLTNVKKLQTVSTSRAELVKAFDTSVIELELLAIGGKGKDIKDTTPKAILRIKFDFTAIPQIAYQEGSARGAIHVGKTIITIEGIVATEKQIQDYIKKQEEEDYEILQSIDESIGAMKEELEKYLKMAGELEKKEEKKEEKEGFFEPFKAIYEGFKEIFTLGKKIERKEELPRFKTKDELEAVEGTFKEAKGKAYTLYYVFKKAFGMITE